jgi:hypothetical protein
VEKSPNKLNINSKLDSPPKDAPHVSPSKRGSHGKVPKIDTKRIVAGMVDLTLNESKEGGPDDETISDAEWAALKARRKAAKKSKRRIHRLAQEAAERNNSSGVGSARDSEPDTRRQSQTSEQRILEAQSQRNKRRKEKYRHKESDQGGPGAMSSRLEEDDESQQDGPRPPSGTAMMRPGGYRDPSGRLTDLIHVDVNSELPQIDYFRGNASLHQSVQSHQGRGPGFGGRRGGPGAGVYDDLAGGHSLQTSDSIVTKSQFPSWH